MAALPPMPENWEDTRATLHAYSQTVAALPRALASAHDKSWHTAFTVEDDGLTTVPIPLPDGVTATLRMDLGTHQVVLAASDGREWAWPMDAGWTSTKLGDALTATAAELGLSGDYATDRYESDDPRPYDRAAAEAFYEVLRVVVAVFAEHRAQLDGEVSPIHLWPHGFDLSFEWFGTRVQEYEGTEYPSQLNLGFYPAGDAYFYSNPWPFDVDSLLDESLPEACTWNVDGWQGTKLRFADLADDPTATQRLLEYAARVFEVARPTLTT